MCLLIKQECLCGLYQALLSSLFGPFIISKPGPCSISLHPLAVYLSAFLCVDIHYKPNKVWLIFNSIFKTVYIGLWRLPMTWTSCHIIQFWEGFHLVFLLPLQLWTKHDGFMANKERKLPVLILPSQRVASLFLKLHTPPTKKKAPTTWFIT